MKSCLIVDDSNENLTLFKNIIEDQDFVVIQVHSDFEAIQILRMVKVNTILSCESNGKRILEKLSSLPYRPFVIIHLENDQSPSEELMNLGADVVILRPKEPSDLVKFFLKN